jgi:hypothetical protein
MALGSTVVLSVEASANAASYQWKRGGVTLTGANRALLTLTNLSAADAGSYTVEVGNEAGTISSTPATIGIASAERGRIANFSIRSNAGAGAQTLIVGFAVDGAASANAQSLLLRGVGPGLAGFSVSGALADPKLELYRSATKLVENDNWDAASDLAALASQVNAFALTAGSRDAALQQTGLAAGAYTAQISSANAGQTGIALAEIFDATTPGASARQLVNVSARTQVAAGDNTLIAGFVISGTAGRTVLIRAAGPVLSTFGVTGALADPKLTVYRETTVIAESDNWQSSVDVVNAFSAAGAFNFNARSRDAVLLLTLPPGAYTAQVSGAAANPSGVALVEIYTLP